METCSFVSQLAAILRYQTLKTANNIKIYRLNVILQNSVQSVSALFNNYHLQPIFFLFCNNRTAVSWVVNYSFPLIISVKYSDVFLVISIYTHVLQIRCVFIDYIHSSPLRKTCSEKNVKMHLPSDAFPPPSSAPDRWRFHPYRCRIYLTFLSFLDFSTVPCANVTNCSEFLQSIILVMVYSLAAVFPKSW